MKQVIVIFLVGIFSFAGCSVPQTKNRNKVLDGLVERLLPGYVDKFDFEGIQSENENDVFEIESKGDKIIIRGNNNVAMARGLNHYMRYYLHSSTSWLGENLKIKGPLPLLQSKVRITSQYPYRYYLNYCTYSYSMAFWDWNRWEKEIDWMALQGINLPLAIAGQQAVWQNVLRRLDYSEEEIHSFLPGPGFEAWWLMGNLEKWGGPVSQSYINRQQELQQKIVTRMKEYGMKPVFQGFYGMVPNSLVNKKKNARIRDTGKWLVYQRPAFIDPTDPYFQEVAKIWYEELENLYGKTDFFGGDPFHEGGVKDSIDITKASSNIYEAMKQNNKDAVWILQGWQQNPTDELLRGLEKGNVIILDLMACSRPQWGGVKESWFHKEHGHLDHNWIWCALPNFGGRIGLYGKLNHYANDALFARNHAMGKNISGIGMAPEGIETNPINYDILYDAAWVDQSIDVSDWLIEYAHYRYGKDLPSIRKAWRILGETVYNSPTQEDGPQESILCARPSREIKHVSAWGTALLYYKPERLVEALQLMLQARGELNHSDTYQYDIVDITRQMLADYGKHLHEKMIAAYDVKDRNAFRLYSDRLLKLILDQDRLLTTRKEFLVGRWIHEARAQGSDMGEKNLFERNAKIQITTWADVDSDLHEYSHREWAGILKDLYYERWREYINYLQSKLDNRQVSEPDFFKMEKSWANAHTQYQYLPSGDPVETAQTIFTHYKHEIETAYGI